MIEKHSSIIKMICITISILLLLFIYNKTRYIMKLKNDTTNEFISQFQIRTGDFYKK